MSGLAAKESMSVDVENWQFDDAVTALVSDRNGVLTAGTASGELQVINRETLPLKSHKGGIIQLCPHPAGDMLISAGEDGQVFIHEAGESRLLLGVRGWVEQLAWSPDGKYLSVSAGSTLFLFNRKGNALHDIGEWSDTPRVLGMAFAPDSRRLATAANKGIYLWRIGEKKPARLMNFPGAAISLAWQPNGKALAVGTQDGFLQVWRQSQVSGKNKSGVLTMRGYPSKVNCLAWHPGVAALATAGGNDVVVWDLSNPNAAGKAIPLRAHEKTITRICWSADGKYLATGDRSGVVSLWDHKGNLLENYEADSEISVLAWTRMNELAFGTVKGSVQLKAIEM